MEPKTPLDALFDFNHDGELGGFEQASRDAFFLSAVLGDEDEDGGEDEFGDEDGLDGFDDE